MNLKILFVILLYYSLISMFFLFGGTELSEYSATGNLSTFDTSNETAIPNVFQTAGSFGRFWLFTSFGIGLSSDTPAWFSFAFMIWQTIFSIFVIGFIISSIWNG